MKMAMSVVAVLLVGCPATSEPPCTDADFGAVVAAHEAALAKWCMGQGPNCEKRKEIDADFKNELQRLVNCQR